MLCVWLCCAAVTFQWPGEVHKAVQRVEQQSLAVPYQDIQILKAAATPATIALLVQLLDREDQGTRIQAARALAELERTRWQPVVGEGGRTLEGALVDWLDEPEPALRVTACDLLGQIGAVQQRARVSMMVTDADLEVRATCVRTLLALYQGSTDTEPVKNLTVQLLSDPYFEVRRNAVTGLGMLGVKESFVAFLPMLESDNADLRRLALEAVARIDPEKAMPFAVEALEDDDLEVKVSAIRALGTIGDPAVLDHLTPLLSEPLLDMHVVAALATIHDPAVGVLLVDLLHVTRLRNAALNALAIQGQVAVDVVAEELMVSTDADHIRSLVMAAKLHPSVEYLPGLARILAISPARKVDVIEVLEGMAARDSLVMALTFVADPTPKIRARALEACGVILESLGGDPVADEIIIDALCDEDRAVRLVALRLIRRWRIQGAGQILVGLLGTTVSEQKVGAAAALLATGEPYAVPVLVDALLGPDDAQARIAASVLVAETPARALGPLVDLVDDDFLDKPPRRAGLVVDVLGRVMGEHSSDEARKLLADMMAHVKPPVRALGARAAALSGDPALHDRLQALLSGGVEPVRRAIAPRLVGAQAHDLVLAALSDPDDLVRALAVLSLERSPAFGEDRKLELMLGALSDADELVRINAASSLRAHASSLGGRTGELCSAYDRDLTDMEMVSAMMLLADAGATCLNERLERFVFTPGPGPRSMVLEALRIGSTTGAVQLTPRLRAGLGVCASLPSGKSSDMCADILEGADLSAHECRDWGSPLAYAGAGQPGMMGVWIPQVTPASQAQDPPMDPVMAGTYAPVLETPVSEGGPLFVVDGAFTIHAAVIEQGLVTGLGEPSCSGYRGISLLRF